eukprot:GDKI01028269.1.p1 GENE.GDKI01028269.1~~GDKI01028269.1.p1  ORF type:complete len:114 (-),score=8.40 GDKI01028269.1:284-625(-)
MIGVTFVNLLTNHLPVNTSRDDRQSDGDTLTLLTTLCYAKYSAISRGYATLAVCVKLFDATVLMLLCFLVQVCVCVCVYELLHLDLWLLVARLSAVAKCFCVMHVLCVPLVSV